MSDSPQCNKQRISLNCHPAYIDPIKYILSFILCYSFLNENFITALPCMHRSVFAKVVVSPHGGQMSKHFTSISVGR